MRGTKKKKGSWEKLGQIREGIHGPNKTKVQCTGKRGWRADQTSRRLGDLTIKKKVSSWVNLGKASPVGLLWSRGGKGLRGRIKKKKKEKKKKPKKEKKKKNRKRKKKKKKKKQKKTQKKKKNKDKKRKKKGKKKKKNTKKSKKNTETLRNTH